MLRVSVGAETSVGLCIMSYKANFRFDYHNKRSNTPNNTSSRKRSKMYWSTSTFAPSVAICIGRIICHRLSAAISIGRSNNMSLLKRSNMYWPINMSSLKSSNNMYWSTNMSSRIGSNMHWLHQYATKFNIIYNTYWNSFTSYCRRCEDFIWNFGMVQIVHEAADLSKDQDQRLADKAIDTLIIMRSGMN